MNQDHQNIEKTPAEQTEEIPAGQTEKKTEGKQKQMTNEELARSVSHGKMVLATPIRASNKDVTELHFDFTKLTGWEFAQAMDKDTSGRTNAFRVTQTQAFALFAAAVEKCTDGVDAEDIRRRMGIEDTIKATQLATAFFNFTSRAANRRITS